MVGLLLLLLGSAVFMGFLEICQGRKTTRGIFADFFWFLLLVRLFINSLKKVMSKQVAQIV